VNKNAVIKNRNVASARPKGETKYSVCPQCGRKGVYPVKGKYSRCRYCGLYRMLVPEADYKGERIFLAIMAKRDKRK
jgi:DNA-directed RNA polymerase subunit RPC12/RpoP